MLLYKPLQPYERVIIKMRINVLDKGFVELIETMGSDSTIADSARISYVGKRSTKEADAKLIRMLMKNGHTSPFEQVEFRFLVKAPIYVARQWMRHRIWSFNEKSLRYTAKGINEYYLPELNDEASKIYVDAVELGIESYNRLLELGIPKEQARGILPTSLYTVFYAKTDLHNLFHFLELRLGKGAQYEISEYANAICKLIEPIVPIAFAEWTYKLGETHSDNTI